MAAEQERTRGTEWGEERASEREKTDLGDRNYTEKYAGASD